MALGDLVVNLIARTRRFTGPLRRAQGLLRSTAVAAGSLALTLAPLGGVAAFAQMIRSGEEFNQKMRQSLAIMGDVSETMRGEMRDAAFDVARSTRFGASQAAEAYFFLASAGLNARQSVAALPAVAAFAQAGNFDLARATDLATDAQSALGLTVEDTQQNLLNLKQVTDVLVKANTLANASVEQFSTSLTTKAGAALKIVGKEIEEGVAVLAAFADQGVKGEQSGTALNIVLRDLQTKAIQNAQAFREAGVAVFDSAGEMNNLADIVGDLENRLAGLSDQQAKAALLQLGFADKSVIFIQTLLGMSEKIREYERELRKAGGTTKEVADKQLTPIQEAMAKLAAATTEVGAALNTEFSPEVALGITLLASLVESTKTLISWFGSFMDLLLRVGRVSGFVFANLQRVGELAGKAILLSLVILGNNIKHLFTGVMPSLFRWFRENWRDLFLTAFDLAATVFINLGKNIRAAMREIWDFIASGGEDTLEISWKPLTDGFVNELRKLPQIPERPISELEARLREDVSRLSNELGQEFDDLFPKPTLNKDLVRQALLAGAGLSLTTAFGATQTRSKPRSEGQDEEKKERAETRFAAALDIRSSQGFSEVVRGLAQGQRGGLQKQMADNSKKSAASSAKTADVLQNKIAPDINEMKRDVRKIPRPQVRGFGG